MTVLDWFSPQSLRVKSANAQCVWDSSTINPFPYFSISYLGNRNDFFLTFSLALWFCTFQVPSLQCSPNWFAKAQLTILDTNHLLFLPHPLNAKSIDHNVT